MKGRAKGKASTEAPAEIPVLTLIAQIKDRKIRASLLSPEDRRRCAEVLRAEGYGVAEIAQILERNERTIRRDLDQVRAEHALEPHPRLVEQLTGQLAREAEISVSRLRRIARDVGVSGMEKLMAEGLAWKVFKEYFEKLQSVGYLPRVPAGLVADVYQHGDVEPIATYDDLARQLREVVEVSQATGKHSTEQADRCLSLLDEVERGRLSVKLGRIVKEDHSGKE